MSDKKVAIVTGGAAGLGLAVARALSKSDFKVVVFDFSEDKLKSLDSELIGKCVDVTQEEQMLNAVREVVETFGAIHLLVNNAGTIYSEPLLNLMNRERRRHDFTAFKRNIEINLSAVFLVGSIVAETMVQKRIQGNIINISSISACGNAGQSAYSAAKAGVEAMTRVWSKELGMFGIRVNAIAPGFMDTESTRKALSEQKIKDWTQRTPLRRLGKDENVAQCVLSIVENDFITGAVMSIDGGLTL